jgi:methionyl-tRNA synthetase
VIHRSLDHSSMSWSYDMHLQSLLSASDVEGMPFGSVFGTVPPHHVSKGHSHQDGEMFIALDGTATVVVDGGERRLQRGDAVYLPPFSVHEIRNDGDAPFDLVSIYWDNLDAAVSELERRPPDPGAPQRALVFCPPPTPNGGLHLGHLAGPYVRADLYARALRSKGCDVDLITGTDDHQSYVGVAARQREASPANVADTWGDNVVATLDRALVEATRLTRPRLDPDHAAGVTKLLQRVVDSGAVASRTVETAYCESCGLSLHQAFAQGHCPECGESSDGEICEACGRPGEARELEGVHCRSCGQDAATRPEESLWLDLESYRDRLGSYIRRTQGGSDLRALVESLLEDPAGLRPYRLTRVSDWGIPWSGAEARHGPQVVDAWVDLALTYLLAARAAAGTDGPPQQIALFLGYDNSFYYGVLLPAIAFAAGLEELLPTCFVTNQFLHLDGEKFSTSRGHAVWADDALDASAADAVRAALLRHAPEGAVTSVSAAELRRLDRDPLYGIALEWVGGFGALVDGEGASVPGTGAWTGAHREFYRYLNSLTEQLDAFLLPESFSARAYVRGLEALVDRALTFRATEAPLRTTPGLQEEARTSLALEFLAAKAFAALALPALPDTGMRLWSALNLPGAPMRERRWEFLPAGHVVSPPFPGQSGIAPAARAVASNA